MAFSFFSSQTANGDSAIYGGLSVSAERRHPMAIYVSGNFGGGTITPYASPDGVNWFTIPGVSPVTTAGIFLVDISALALKLTLTGATSPNLTAVAAS